LDGLRSVFKDFHEVAGGSSGTGPVGAWAEMTMNLAGIFCRRPSISYGLRFLVGWGLYPISFLGRLIIKKVPEALIAGGICCLGEKSKEEH